MRTTDRGARAARLLLPGVALLALTGAALAGAAPAKTETVTGSGLGVAPSLPGGTGGLGTDACGRSTEPSLWDMLFPTCNRDDEGRPLG
ncbi:hypothetical protein [Micromonospora echinospora]|uniref:hypothetical protein n=1 Tax=Micromonospora echinospora TaxID=1877 RepID=UPI003670F8B3